MSVIFELNKSKFTKNESKGLRWNQGDGEREIDIGEYRLALSVTAATNHM